MHGHPLDFPNRAFGEQDAPDRRGVDSVETHEQYISTKSPENPLQRLVKQSQLPSLASSKCSVTDWRMESVDVRRLADAAGWAKD
jgi:hypothetical protein